MTRRRKQPARDRARYWLLRALECGPVTVEALRWRAMKSGLAWRTVQRARVGIAEARKSGFDRSHWVWAKVATPSTEGRQPGGVCPTCLREWGTADERP